MNANLKRAKILSYTANPRTAQVHIHGLTDGASEGLTATFAYPVGDDDKDTEREILANADVYVFFEDGNEERPVIAFYCSHGVGAVVDTRRIRQKNIEVLARSKILMTAKEEMEVETPTLTIRANIKIIGDIEHEGNTEQTGDTTSTGVVTGKAGVRTATIDVDTHPHDGGTVNGKTLGPIPM